MKKKRALAASRIPDQELEQNLQSLTFNDPDAEPNSLVFVIDNDQEMLKITKTDFFVRGKRVEQDHKEAEIVYNAVREFLTYHAISRRY